MLELISDPPQWDAAFAMPGMTPPRLGWLAREAERAATEDQDDGGAAALDAFLDRTADAFFLEGTWGDLLRPDIWASRRLRRRLDPLRFLFGPIECAQLTEIVRWLHTHILRGKPPAQVPAASLARARAEWEQDPRSTRHTLLLALLDRGFDVNACPCRGPPLHAAPNLRTLRLLLWARPEIRDRPGGTGLSALQQALMYGDVAAAELLLGLTPHGRFLGVFFTDRVCKFERESALLTWEEVRRRLIPHGSFRRRALQECGRRAQPK